MSAGAFLGLRRGRASALDAEGAAAARRSCSRPVIVLFARNVADRTSSPRWWGSCAGFPPGPTWPSTWRAAG